MDYYTHMTNPTAEETEHLTKFQIKSLDDSEFGITLLVNENEDPETKALEYLGYFVVPESSIV